MRLVAYRLVTPRYSALADGSPSLQLAGMIPNEVIVSTKICKQALTVQALCALMRLVTHRLITPRYSALADGSPSLQLAGMIPNEVIVSTKICKQALTVQALCALMRLVTHRLITPRYSALANSGPSLWLAGMIPKQVIVSLKRCEPSTVQALCALMRLVTHRLVTPRYSALADSGPSLWLAGMIPKQVIVSTKRCEPSTVQALCALMRLVTYRLVTPRYSALADSGPSLRLAVIIPKEVIVSTKRCEPSPIQTLCALMR